MLKLLLIAPDSSRSFDSQYHDLETELSKNTVFHIWRKSGRIERILRKLPFVPDFILIINDLGPSLSPYINGLSSINIPCGLIVNDVHRLVESRRSFIKKNKIEHLFSVVKNKFGEIYPEFEKKMVWLPHFINPKIHNDYGLEKDIELLMMGAVSPEIYPLRQHILTYYQNDKDFIYHPHPGYDSIEAKENPDIYSGRKYATEINRSKIFFTCPSVHHYPVKKYFEALACKSLLLAPQFNELLELGFEPGNHFIPITEDNFADQAKYFLGNSTERTRISEQGYQFVHQHHNLQVRTRELVAHIKQIIE